MTEWCNKTVLKDQCWREYHRSLNCTLYMHNKIDLSICTRKIFSIHLLANVIVLEWLIYVFNLLCGTQFLL